MSQKTPNIDGFLDFLTFHSKLAKSDQEFEIPEYQIDLAEMIINLRNKHANIPSGMGKTFTYNLVNDYFDHIGLDKDVYGIER